MRNTIIKRAWSDTFRSFGGLGWLYTIFFVPPVGFALHYLAAGSEAMNAELQIWLIYGLAAAGVVFLAVFLWNLVAAPYRLQKERADRSESHNATMLARLEALEEEKKLGKPRLVGEIEATSWGGRFAELDDRTAFVAFVRIRNAGSMASVALNWQVWITSEDGVTTKHNLTHIDEMNLHPEGVNWSMKLTADGAIYNKCLAPIQPGGMVDGFACTIMPLVDFQRPKNIAVRFEDVLGNEVVFSHEGLRGITDFDMRLPSQQYEYRQLEAKVSGTDSA